MVAQVLIHVWPCWVRSIAIGYVLPGSRGYQVSSCASAAECDRLADSKHEWMCTDCSGRHSGGSMCIPLPITMPYLKSLDLGNPSGSIGSGPTHVCAPMTEILYALQHTWKARLWVGALVPHVVDISKKCCPGGRNYEAKCELVSALVQHCVYHGCTH